MYLLNLTTICYYVDTAVKSSGQKGDTSFVRTQNRSWNGVTRCLFWLVLRCIVWGTPGSLLAWWRHRRGGCLHCLL